MVKVRLESVTIKSRVPDLSRRLSPSPVLPWVPISINSAKAMDTIAREAPVDGREIVVWMHYAAADNAVFTAACRDYNRSGGNAESGSDDPYIPGLVVGDLRAVSVRGSVVRSRGYGEVESPEGLFRVPVNGKTTFAKGRVLAWGALPWAGDIQWVLTLIRWTRLATTPITDRIRFPSSHGLVAPHFFSVAPRIPAPVMQLRIGLTSDKPQRVIVRGRGTEGYYHDILFEDAFNIDAGQSEAVYTVFGFPFVSTFTLEIQPSDGTETVLDYIDTIP